MASQANSYSHYVFAYGTLKTGEPNCGVITDAKNGKAIFLGKGKTLKKWPLVIASSYNIPYLLHCEGKGHRVAGEVYGVDDKMLHFLDEFECHPRYYVRKEEEVDLVDHEGRTVRQRVWIYFLKNYRQELLSKTFLEEYSSKGNHGLEYVPRYLRFTKDPKNSHRHEVQLASEDQWH